MKKTEKTHEQSLKEMQDNGVFGPYKLVLVKCGFGMPMIYDEGCVSDGYEWTVSKGGKMITVQYNEGMPKETFRRMVRSIVGLTYDS